MEVSMSVWSGAVIPAPFLATPEGELVSIRISTDPRSLEDLLECLASLPFPVNPQLYHGVPTVVDFPAYTAHIRAVRDALKAYGFKPEAAEVHNMLETLVS
jgi:hypothetical protein